MAVDKLEGVHPTLVLKVRRIMDALTVLGCPVLVTQGVRTTAQQLALYEQGRGKPGKVVTHADGIKVRSNHQVKDDGFGHAVDFAFYDDDGKPSWAESEPWQLLGLMAVQQGLTWGGNWKTIVDKPHVELP